MYKLLFSAAALALVSVPAQAQVLGGLGGGMGGVLGGGMGGTLGGIGGLDSTLGTATRSVRTATSGAVDGKAATNGSQKVDRKAGKVEASRSVDAGLTGNTSSMLDTPIAGMAGSASGSGSAAGQGSASAQLIGTDTVRSTLQNGTGKVRDTAGQVRDTATSRVEQVRGAATDRAAQLRDTAGNAAGSASGSASGSATGSAAGSLTGALGGMASGSASGSGSGSASGQLLDTGAVTGAAQDGIDRVRSAAGGLRDTATGRAGQLRDAAGNLAGTASGSAAGAGSAAGSLQAVSGSLAAAGSAAASGDGMFAVAPNMPVLNADGEKIGKVKQLVTDQTGRVREVLVEAKGAKALIPAGNFTAEGSALISAMGQADLQQAAAEQEAAQP